LATTRVHPTHNSRFWMPHIRASGVLAVEERTRLLLTESTLSVELANMGPHSRHSAAISPPELPLKEQEKPY